ncbi:CYFA0S10e01838g1_1 [Cyberlindnera fabianii]|uniref:Acyl-CoA desaturase n=1 Tax=Cyberlindnera fabianii TaxID=36022 RepID=A0A061AZT0_CYBFA|nr:Acyl-CoA desaturase 1 [Cyberlindnera fabianii]CDR42748.1 CYFA0S10e01838g1_1 [Cyberlindnera fabianii]
MTTLENVDVLQANIIAAGTNKKAKRIVNSFGTLMGSREYNEEQDEDSAGVQEILAKDKAEKAKWANKKHISEQPWTLQNWHQHINWLNVVLVMVIPAIGLYMTRSTPLKWQTAATAIIQYVFSGISITAGYHRLWAHKAYNARLPLRLFFALFGAASVEGSIKWWGHSHRIHHRYTDTPRDPYDARQGFWYSHMGWMLVQPNPKHKARADISDLIDDWVVRVQHKHYMLIMALVGFVLPTLFCGYFFNDYKGGFVYAGICRVFFIQQATFCVNSLAHWIGVQPFDDRRTPRDHWITALVTFGEGYHNFHHEFPSDYRNAIKWYQYDPTKVLIWASSKVGLAYNLKTFSQNAIEQGLVQQQQKKIDKMRRNLNWGTPLSQLPVWDKEEFVEKCKGDNAKGLVIINGIVHDVSGYISEHPGGEPLLMASIGKDASKAFNGGVYLHSNAAHNLLATMRVAVIRDSFAARRQENELKKEQ